MPVSWIIDYAPPWLGPLLLFFGMTLCAISGVTTILSDIIKENPEFQDAKLSRIQIGVGGLVIGLTITYLPYYINQSGSWAFAFFLWGRWLEGIVGPRVVIKILGFLSRSSSSRPNTRRYLTTKLIYYGTIFFILMLLGWVGILAYSIGPFTNSIFSDMIVIWTLMTFLISAFGVFWWFRDVNLSNRPEIYDGARSVSFPSLLFAGMIFGIGGAQIYNFNPALIDLINFIAGNIVYTVGYWLTLLIWLGSDN